MQINLPIAICLFEHTKKKATGNVRAARLDIGLHQIRPDVPRSIANYSESGDNKNAKLLHHVVIFSTMSYAECQKDVREKIAELSGGRLVGKTKEIVGDKAEIIDAMTTVALDCSWLLDVQKARLERNYPRHAGHKYGGGHDREANEPRSEDLEQYAVGDDEENEDADDDFDSLDGFIVDDRESEDGTTESDESDEEEEKQPAKKRRA